MLDLPHSPRSTPRSDPAPALRARPRVRGARRTCLIVPEHPERALSLALVQHFALELPDVELVLDCAEPDVVWICGYERGHEGRVREWRRRHPRAVLVVTGKGPEELWGPAVLAAGADSVLSWPVDTGRLARVLRRSLQRRA